MAPRYLCDNCGFLGEPRRELRGSPALELVLWLLLVVPGAMYAWWRQRGPRFVCARCGSASLFTEDSPRTMTLRAAGLVPDESLGTVIQTSRILTAIPFAGGLLVVLVFALSIAFPEVRGQLWFQACVVLAGVAVIAHPLWSALHVILGLVVRFRSRDQDRDEEE